MTARIAAALHGIADRTKRVAAAAVMFSLPRAGERSRDWLKMKNPAAPAVKREAEEDWG